jgi:hypothetical protein
MKRAEMPEQKPQVVCMAKNCIHNIATSCNAMELLIVGENAHPADIRFAEATPTTSEATQTTRPNA